MKVLSKKYEMLWYEMKELIRNEKNGHEDYYSKLSEHSGFHILYKTLSRLLNNRDEYSYKLDLNKRRKK